MKGPKFIAVIWQSPRSKKLTYLLAKQVSEPRVLGAEIYSPDAGILYEVWSKYERLSDAQERAENLNKGL